MSLKLDMSKTYDKVEWDYLEQVLLILNFPSQFVHLLMFCVKFVAFSMLVSGQLRGLILPRRGLRQGDTPSPYLFLLCAESLVHLLKMAAVNSLKGIRVCHGAPKINHLLFVDDSLIFCKIDKNSSCKLLEILKRYEMASGQCINTTKTTIVFSKIVDSNTM